MEKEEYLRAAIVIENGKWRLKKESVFLTSANFCESFLVVFEKICLNTRVSVKTVLATVIVVAASLLLSCHTVHNKTSQFDCLPDNVELDEYVTRVEDRRVTVTDKLLELKADCDRGELVDGDKKGVRFFRSYCGGAAPPEFLLQRKHDELAELQKQYTVIVMECDIDLPALPR